VANPSIAQQGDAETVLRRAVALTPDAQAWETLGTILAGRGGALAESRDCYAVAVRIEPAFLRALNNLAVILHRLGQLRAAENHYTEVLRLASDNLDTWLNFAVLRGGPRALP